MGFDPKMLNVRLVLAFLLLEGLWKGSPLESLCVDPGISEGKASVPALGRSTMPTNPKAPRAHLPLPLLPGRSEVWQGKELGGKLVKLCRRGVTRFPSWLQPPGHGGGGVQCDGETESLQSLMCVAGAV